MIYFVDGSRLDDLRELTGRQNIYACRIGCLLDSYGLAYDFVSFWVQYGENGKPVSAVSKFCADVTVQTSPETDIREMKEFLEMTGFASLLSGKEMFSGSCSGVIMERVGLSDFWESTQKTEYNPDLKEVYRLLKSCEGKGFEVPSYEDFVLDMSHKIRHNTGMCVGVRENGILKSASMTVSQTESCAIIGGTATNKADRKRGFGSLCIRELCKRLSGRNIFIMREETENEAFYQASGFENTGKFYIKKRYEEKK